MVFVATIVLGPANTDVDPVAAEVASSTCHRAKNADFVGGPPGLPTWHLPPDETPMVFEGRTPSQLCAQLKELTKNGNRSLADLEEIVARAKP